MAARERAGRCCGGGDPGGTRRYRVWSARYFPGSRIAFAAVIPAMRLPYRVFSWDRPRTPNGPTKSAGTPRIRREPPSGYESQYITIYSWVTAICRERIGTPGHPQPAEGVGFEPTVPLPVHQLFGLANSATLAPLRVPAERRMLPRAGSGRHEGCGSGAGISHKPISVATGVRG